MGLKSLPPRRELLAAALGFVGKSRRLILSRRRRGLSVMRKADQTLVTDADVAAERLLRSEIGKRFPEHGIVGEELPGVNLSSEFQWIIDPIDGTLSFARGIPLYGTIIALHHRGRPLLGVIDHPALGECYSAAAGLGAWVNRRRLRLQDLPSGRPVEDEILATGDRAHFGRCGRERLFDLLILGHPQVRSYADCFGHTLAASGAAGAMVDYGVRLWDVAATEVLIQEAGGRYVLAERIEKPKSGSFYGVVFGKPRVVDWILKLFALSKPPPASP